MGTATPRHAADNLVVEELHRRMELGEVHLNRILLAGDHLHHNNRLKTFL